MANTHWLECADPRPMLKLLQLRVSDRKIRLFACACCRRVWDFISPPARRAVEVAEGFADGTVKEKHLEQVLFTAATGRKENVADIAACWTANKQIVVVEGVAFEVAKVVADRVARSRNAKRWKAARDDELRVQANLLRCVVGDPTQPVTFDPAWRTDTATTLARQMYDSRDFSAMPILADALQDAGCDNEEVLNHCRGEGVHVRGCWMVDLVLGKE